MTQLKNLNSFLQNITSSHFKGLYLKSARASAPVQIDNGNENTKELPNYEGNHITLLLTQLRKYVRISYICTAQFSLLFLFKD